jgi:hypothetical protein
LLPAQASWVAIFHGAGISTTVVRRQTPRAFGNPYAVDVKIQSLDGLFSKV